MRLFNNALGIFLFASGAMLLVPALPALAQQGPCSTDADCADPDFPFCYSIFSLCVECLVDSQCDDGLFCNGIEECRIDGLCQAGTAIDCDDSDACTDDSCDDVTGCVNEDTDCDDSDECTDDSCDPATGCVHDDGACDDGLFCNGAETCDAGECVAGDDPCPDEICDEANAECVECLDDADCDDGEFCNGAETCDAGACVAGDDACPDEIWD